MNYRSNMRSRGYQTVQTRCAYPQPAASPAPVVNNCGKVNVPDGIVSLSMVYTVSQCWRNITDGCVGLSRGTIFDELDKPFKGYNCKRGGSARCQEL